MSALTGVIHPVYSGCMTPSQCAILGLSAARLIDDMDHEDREIFGREVHFTKEELDRMIADELRKLVAIHRQVAGS